MIMMVVESCLPRRGLRDIKLQTLLCFCVNFQVQFHSILPPQSFLSITASMIFLECKYQAISLLKEPSVGLHHLCKVKPVEPFFLKNLYACKSWHRFQVKKFWTMRVSELCIIKAYKGFEILPPAYIAIIHTQYCHHFILFCNHIK